MWFCNFRTVNQIKISIDIYVDSHEIDVYEKQ
jgi:hypothetical protein